MWQFIVILISYQILVQSGITLSHVEPPGDLVRVHSSGFLPFEPPVLPYGIIERIQAHQLRIARQRQWQSDEHELTRRVQQPAADVTKVRATIATKFHMVPKAKVPQYRLRGMHNLIQPRSSRMHLERSLENANHFNLYDADGEHLLAVKYHDADDNIAGRAATRPTSTKSAPLTVGQMGRRFKSRSPPKDAKEVQHYLLQV